jgi:hypothetical protein
MRIFVFLMFGIVSLQAGASFIQVNCSNGAGTIKWNSGHVQNGFVVTEYTYEYGEEEYSEIDLKLSEVNVEILLREEIATESSKRCNEETKSGVVDWRKVTAKKVTLTKADGSGFGENTLGASEDLMSVTGYLICEEVGNSRTMCP